MKKTEILIILLSLLIIGGCSDSNSQQSSGTKKTRNPNASPPVITDLKFESPSPTAGDFVRVVPEINKEKYPTDFTYHCKWFVNGSLVPQQPSIQLKKGSYKRGDKVFCKLRVVSRTTKLESSEVESPKITIINSSPQTLKDEDDISFKPPGIFRYSIQASDDDGDTLSYRLIGPLKRELKLNTKTGEIEFQLSSLSEKPLKIIVDVTDGHGGSSIFTLNLKKRVNSSVFGQEPQ